MRQRVDPLATARCASLIAVIVWTAVGPQAAAQRADPPIDMLEVGSAEHHQSFSAKDIWGYAAAGREYALVPDGGALRIYDVTDPGRPQLARSVLAVGADMKDVKVARHYAYAVHQAGPLQIVDLQDPYRAYTAATYHSAQITGAHNLAIEGDFLYLAMQGAGAGDLRILDISDPLKPIERGSYRHPAHVSSGGCHDVFVRGDLCYASYFRAGLVILDVSDKDNPLPIQPITYPDPATHNAWPGADPRYVYITDEQPGGHLRVFDQQTRFGLRQVGAYSVANAVVHNVHVKFNHAYLSYYTAGVRVLDLTNPARPREVGAYDTSSLGGSSFSGCWGVYPYAPSGLIYASDTATGLFVLRHTTDAAGLVRGRLGVHGADDESLPGAVVEALDSGVTTTTDDAGVFRMTLLAGTQRLRVAAPGFRDEVHTVAVEDDGVLTLDLTLDPVEGPPAVIEVGTPRPRSDRTLVVPAQIRQAEAGGTALLWYRAAAGPFRSALFSRRSPRRESHEAIIPEHLEGTLLEYYIEITDQRGGRVMAPAGAPARLFRYFVGEPRWSPLVTATFDSGPEGFEVGGIGDDATSGRWEWAVPRGSEVLGTQVQPDLDAAGSGGGCFITENGDAAADPAAHEVDGRTTLVSPEFSGGGARALRLRFDLWFVNDVGGARWQDPLLVEVSADGGQNYVPLATLREVEPGWQAVELDVAARHEPTSRMRVRFVALDTIVPSYVEAAIDNVRIESTDGSQVRQIGGRRQVVLLRQNAPNPFNPTTTISYQLKEPRAVRVRVLDAAGRTVRELRRGQALAGDHKVVWDARDTRGARVASGVYFYELEAGGVRQTRKMMLIE